MCGCEKVRTVNETNWKEHKILMNFSKMKNFNYWDPCKYLLSDFGFWCVFCSVFIPFSNKQQTKKQHAFFLNFQLKLKMIVNDRHCTWLPHLRINREPQIFLCKLSESFSKSTQRIEQLGMNTKFSRNFIWIVTTLTFLIIMISYTLISFRCAFCSLHLPFLDNDAN